MDAKPKRGWDAQSHEDLLLSMIDEIKPNKAIIESVTEKMRKKGYLYSYDAIKCIYSLSFISSLPNKGLANTFSSQHVQKLRRKRENEGNQNADGVSGTDSPAPTPRKATPRKRATPSKKGAKAKATKVDDDVDDEIADLKQESEESEEEPAPPPKRAKKTK